MKKQINHFWSNFLPQRAQRTQRLFLTICTLCTAWFTSAQTTTENFVKTTTYKGAGATLPAVQVTYFDGLGRPIQQIANAQSATGKDIVTYMEYDAWGECPKSICLMPTRRPH